MVEVLVHRRSGVIHFPDTLFPQYPRCKPHGDPDNYERKGVREDSRQMWCGRCLRIKDA